MNIFFSRMSKNIFSSRMSKNIFSSRMNENIFSSRMSKNILLLSMRRNILLGNPYEVLHYAQSNNELILGGQIMYTGQSKDKYILHLNVSSKYVSVRATETQNRQRATEPCRARSTRH